MQRDQVFAQLDSLCRPGKALDPETFRLPGINAAGLASFDRVRARSALVEQYLERQHSVPRNGLAAVITAGPPGAGKSAHIRENYPQTAWRILDADVVKDLILAREVPEGTFSRQLATRLVDGHPIMPRELAGLVHRESIVIADIIRRLCMSDGENIVIEGTLAWPEQGHWLLRELAATGYDRVDIVSVDIPQPEALDRSRQRWWAARQSAIAGGDAFGGRFVPTDAVARSYDSSGGNICTANARATFNDAAAQMFTHVQLTTQSAGHTETISNSGQGS